MFEAARKGLNNKQRARNDEIKEHLLEHHRPSYVIFNRDLLPIPWDDEYLVNQGNDHIQGSCDNDTLIGDFGMIAMNVLTAKFHLQINSTNLADDVWEILGTALLQSYEKIQEVVTRPRHVIPERFLVQYTPTNIFDATPEDDFFWLGQLSYFQRRGGIEAQRKAPVTLYADNITGAEGNDILSADVFSHAFDILSSSGKQIVDAKGRYHNIKRAFFDRFTHDDNPRSFNRYLLDSLDRTDFTLSQDLLAGGTGVDFVIYDKFKDVVSLEPDRAPEDRFYDTINAPDILYSPQFAGAPPPFYDFFVGNATTNQRGFDILEAVVLNTALVAPSALRNKEEMEEKPCEYRFDWKFGSYKPKPICSEDFVCRVPERPPQVCPPGFNITLWVEHVCPVVDDVLRPPTGVLEPSYYKDILLWFVRDAPRHYRDYCNCNDQLQIRVLEVIVERPFLITLRIEATINGVAVSDAKILRFLNALCSCSIGSIVPRWGWLIHASYSVTHTPDALSQCRISDEITCREAPAQVPPATGFDLLPF